MTAWMRKALGSEQTGIFGLLTKILLMILGTLVMISLTGCKEHAVGMLNPKGIITYHERKLLFDTLALMLIVVLPVIVMSLTFVYHYQVSHRVTDYKPNWAHSYFLESIWWTVPCVIVVILAVITWEKTHELDPYNRIAGATGEPMLIQAIATEWKWVFIYPEQNIATVNYLEIPVNRQVEFWITADNAPMSAFFIPQLGSQIYAMAGMRTRLHLLANEIGVYEGLNTQYNGQGFADMNFKVHVVGQGDMEAWVAKVKSSASSLTKTEYDKLLKPTIGNKPTFYAGVEKGIFENAIKIYMNTYGTVHPRQDDN